MCCFPSGCLSWHCDSEVCQTIAAVYVASWTSLLDPLMDNFPSECLNLHSDSELLPEET